MNILVSGGAGYIGSVLCQRLLEAGHKVVVFDNFTNNNKSSIINLLSNKNFDLWRMDAWEIDEYEEIVKDVDIIIPLAAVVGMPACDKSPNTATQINYIAIKKLVDMVKYNQRIISPNTNSGYGIGGEAYCTEESPLQPISHYGITKCLGEKEVLCHKNSVSLRLATVCGLSPRMRFDLLVNDLSAQLYYNRKVVIFEPDFKRNYVHIEDVCRAFIFMIDNPQITGVYNVGHPLANTSKMELAVAICQIYGIDPVEAISIGEGNDPDKRNYLISNEKIIKAGFNFNFTLYDAIKDIEKFLIFHKQEEIGGMRNA